jgi:hypothetical protein
MQALGKNAQNDPKVAHLIQLKAAFQHALEWKYVLRLFPKSHHVNLADFISPINRARYDQMRKGANQESTKGGSLFSFSLFSRSFWSLC